MQVVGPYRLVGELGSGEVGTVWAAVDPAGVEVTLAVLDPAAASDQGWRDAFSSAANELARGGMPALHADFTAAAPWVAVAAGPGPGAEQIFTALGQEYQGSAGSPSGARPGPWPPAGDGTGRESAGPASGGPVSPGVVASDPISGTSVSSGSVSGGGSWSESAPSLQQRVPSGRARVWIGGIMLLVLLPGVGGGIITTTLAVGQSGTGAPLISATASPPWPSAQPSEPGVEPPRSGSWPDEWPDFKSADRTKRMSNLDGLGFSFDVPGGWDCVLVGRASSEVRYRCGAQAGGPAVAGGDLVVRSCPVPCDDGRRVEMRRAEEAWGLRWTRSGSFTAWAETNEINGNPRYGLVFVSYWRSTPESPIDRQLVFRMTAPVDRADELRKVANDIRSAIF